MSIEHPIHHHLRANKRRANRRIVVDVTLVALLLLFVVMVSIVHLRNIRSAQEARLREASLARVDRPQHDLSVPPNFSNTEETESETESTIESGTDVAEPVESVVAEAESDTLVGDTGILDESDLFQLPPTPTLATPPSSGVTGFVRFEDVTVTRYQNVQLGFVMELPVGWSEVYARGDEALFARGNFYSNALFSDVVKNSDAMWIRIIRPCTSTMATSTIFSFATSTGGIAREAYACIPPFLVTLGYNIPRDTATDFIGKERFLLSVGRTLYPIVGSQAPYLPIR